MQNLHWFILAMLLAEASMWIPSIDQSLLRKTAEWRYRQIFYAIALIAGGLVIYEDGTKSFWIIVSAIWFAISITFAEIFAVRLQHKQVTGGFNYFLVLGIFPLFRCICEAAALVLVYLSISNW